jgi:hypothetical protein
MRGRRTKKGEKGQEKEGKQLGIFFSETIKHNFFSCK